MQKWIKIGLKNTTIRIAPCGAIPIIGIAPFFKTAVTFLFFEIQQAFKWNMKIQSVKKTFYCYLLTVSKFLHAQKRSLKKVIFKKYFFSKNNLYFKPHISESIVVSWLIQILNFSTDHSYHFRLLNYLKKWILRVVMQFFPKRKKNYRNSPIVGIAPLDPIVPITNIIYKWNLVIYL